MKYDPGGKEFELDSSFFPVSQNHGGGLLMPSSKSSIISVSSPSLQNGNPSGLHPPPYPQSGQFDASGTFRVRL
jgi:hypothetical protein